MYSENQDAKVPNFSSIHDEAEERKTKNNRFYHLEGLKEGRESRRGTYRHSWVIDFGPALLFQPLNQRTAMMRNWVKI